MEIGRDGAHGSHVLPPVETGTRKGTEPVTLPPLLTEASHVPAATETNGSATSQNAPVSIIITP